MMLGKMSKGIAICVALCAALPAFAGSTVKVQIGKLGQSLKSTAIYSSASSRSRIYYRLKPYEYLVINPSKYSTYWKVLLQNGAQGYVRKEAVVELPYNITAEQPAPAAAPTGRDAGNTSSRAWAAQYGTKYTGTPYKWGGNDPLNGIDCSAFVKHCYGQIGISLPRTAAEQALVGTPIRKYEDLQPGDRLYFWDKKRGKIGHTGMYLGNGYFVHSSSGKGGVTTDVLSERWQKICVGARR